MLLAKKGGQPVKARNVGLEVLFWFQVGPKDFILLQKYILPSFFYNKGNQDMRLRVEVALSPPRSTIFFPIAYTNLMGSKLHSTRLDFDFTLDFVLFSGTRT